jgi:hypothetical protein
MGDVDPKTNLYLAYGAGTTDVDVRPAAGVLDTPALASAATSPPVLGEVLPPLPTILEPAPDTASIEKFEAALRQLPPDQIPGFQALTSPRGRFDPLEVRQGWLLNCPLLAILAAMAHVDQGRAAADRRLPRMITAEDLEPRRQGSRRALGLTPAERNHLIEKVPGPFATRFVAHVRFHGRPAADRVTFVLHWNDDFQRIHFAWSRTGAVWPSLVEKAYLHEVLRRREYQARAAAGKIAPEETELKRASITQALRDERAGLAGAGLSYDRIAGLSGLMVMIDLTGGGTEILLSTLSDDQLVAVLKRHAERATIVGTLSDEELAEDFDPASRRLVGNHYLAALDVSESQGTHRVRLVDAQGTGPELLGDEIVELTLAELRQEVGEIVQEV